MNELGSLREIAEARVLQAESEAARAEETAWGSELTRLLDGCQVELNRLGEAWSAVVVDATRDFVAQIDDIDDAASQERRDVLRDAIYKTTTLLKALPHHFANLATCEAHKAAAQVEALGAALHNRKTDTRSRELRLLEQCSSVPENVRNSLDVGGKELCHTGTHKQHQGTLRSKGSA
ncbi:MAG: hypothetical protein KVP17_005018 [Porospora cf. gigantea B]|uniref:uncharacterized protein n=1 Tax=Porospora cf. gigantea B TaxID=2853592 RepID=UPI003571A492|nr:MAG: hypothetical protein KVP17_005018 [Porospora cf. gigantea B]